MYKSTICFILIAGLTSALSHEKVLHKKESHHHRFLTHHHEIKHAAAAVHRIHHHRQAFHHRNSNQTSSNGLTEVFYNETSQFLALFNKSSNVLSIFDSKSSLALLQSNNSNIVYIIDTATNEVYQEENKTVENLLKNSTQLQDLIKPGQVTNSSQINQILSQLGLNSNGLNTFNDISKALNKLNGLNLTGSLFKDQNQSSFEGGLEKFSGAITSLITIFNQVSNNSNLRNNSINLPSILNSTNGVDALVKILQNLTSQPNNSNLTSFLEKIENALEIITKLSDKNSSSCVDNAIKVISAISSLLSGNSNIETFIKTLSDVAKKSRENSITDDVKTTVDKLKKLNNNNNSGMLSSVTKLLQDIENNNSSFSGVDISKLWKLITSGNSKNAGEFVEEVVSLLENVASPSELSKLNSTISGIPGLGAVYQEVVGVFQNANKSVLQLGPNQESSEGSSTGETSPGAPAETSTAGLGQKKAGKARYRIFKHMKKYIQANKEYN